MWHATATQWSKQVQHPIQTRQKEFKNMKEINILISLLSSNDFHFQIHEVFNWSCDSEKVDANVIMKIIQHLCMFITIALSFTGGKKVMKHMNKKRISKIWNTWKKKIHRWIMIHIHYLYIYIYIYIYIYTHTPLKKLYKGICKVHCVQWVNTNRSFTSKYLSGKIIRITNDRAKGY